MVPGSLNIEFYPCARPGRSGETTDDVPDEVVDEWASGLPKPKTPAPLDGPRRHCPALRAAAGPGCTWARPALKTRSSPNGSKAPFSRDDQPSRSPGPRAQRPGEAFSAAINISDRRKGQGSRITGSPWLSELPGAVFRAGPGRRPPRATLPTPQPLSGTEAVSSPEKAPANPQGDHRRRPDLTPPPPHLPPMSAPAGETHRAGVRQTRHEVGPAPPITSPTSAIHPPGAAPCAAPARFLDPPPVTRSRARRWTSAGSSMTLDASLTVIRPCSTARRTAGAAGLSSDSILAA